MAQVPSLPTSARARLKLFEIVAGDAARDFWEARANFIGVSVADLFEGCVDFADAASGGDVRGEFGFGGVTDCHARAVVEKEVEGEDVVYGFAAMSAWTPQELLPIMPPMVQRECVAGSGAKVRLNFSAASRTRSRTMPG